MIIDVHTHLGDVLRPRGGELIWKTGVVKERVFDPVALAELNLYRAGPVTKWLINTVLEDTVTRACQARNATATLENGLRSMDDNEVARSVCLPVAPYVTFDDVRRAREVSDRVLPFTSVDFSTDGDFAATLARDVQAGAKGLKLHPIIQREPLGSQRTTAIIEAFAAYKLPVLFHSGVQSYYLGREKREMQRPEYGDPREAAQLVPRFPNVSFIAGHAAITQYKRSIELFASHRNVYVDVSFQSPGNIRELIRALGPERVMYGSDWPWGDRRANIASVKAACRGDKGLERLLFHDNAARLLALG